MIRNLNTRSPKRLLRYGIGLALLATAGGITPAVAAAATSSDQAQFSVTGGSLSFSTPPAMPTLTAITLNGQTQTTNSTMTNFAVQDATGSGAGWNVTVSGNAATGKSAVFKQYCPTATCGADTGPGYVSTGATLPANSLTLNSTGASFAGQNGSTGTAPSLQCTSGCNVDSATAVKVASAATSAGMGTWGTGGWTASSLALTTPSTLRALANGELYRTDLLWSLNSGP